MHNRKNKHTTLKSPIYPRTIFYNDTYRYSDPTLHWNHFTTLLTLLINIRNKNNNANSLKKKTKLQIQNNFNVPENCLHL